MHILCAFGPNILDCHHTSQLLMHQGSIQYPSPASAEGKNLLLQTQTSTCFHICLVVKWLWLKLESFGQLRFAEYSIRHAVQSPLCDIKSISGCFTGPRTVTRLSFTA